MRDLQRNDFRLPGYDLTFTLVLPSTLATGGCEERMDWANCSGSTLFRVTLNM